MQHVNTILLYGLFENANKYNKYQLEKNYFITDIFEELIIWRMC